MRAIRFGRFDTAMLFVQKGAVIEFNGRSLMDKYALWINILLRHQLILLTTYYLLLRVERSAGHRSAVYALCGAHRF